MNILDKCHINSLESKIQILLENKKTLDSMLLDVYLYFDKYPLLQDNSDIKEDIRIYLEDEGLI